jgi:subtilisin family serine protease
VTQLVQALETHDLGAIVQDVVKAPEGDRAPVYPDRDALLRMGGDPTAIPKGTARVTVAIVDTGMMIDHPALRRHAWHRVAGGRTIHGYRRIGGVADNDVTDDDGHGTQMAGAVLTGAQGAPTVDIMPLKFFDARTRPAAANAAACIELAAREGADILDLSFDVGIPDPALARAIATACEARMLVVIAAGNDGSDNDRFPSVPSCYAADHPDSAVVVMATDQYDEKPGFSNYGVRTVDLAAPGVEIVSTCPFLSNAAFGYRAHSGTSVAAALVAGAAALLKSQRPYLTTAELKKSLLASVDTFGARLKCATGGRLNLGKLL